MGALLEPPLSERLDDMKRELSMKILDYQIQAKLASNKKEEFSKNPRDAFSRNMAQMYDEHLQRHFEQIRRLSALLITLSEAKTDHEIRIALEITKEACSKVYVDPINHPVADLSSVMSVKDIVNDRVDEQIRFSGTMSESALPVVPKHKIHEASSDRIDLLQREDVR